MTEEEPLERLQKALSRAGVASRRVSEGMIEAGRVTINRRVATVGDRVSVTDRIELDGIPVIRDPDLVHYLLNKPVGVVSTSKDPQKRRTVVDLVSSNERIFPE